MKTTLVFALAAAACGGAQTTPGHATGSGRGDIDRLEEELGGPGGLMEFFDGAPESMITDVLRSHDIGFAQHALLSDCTPTFSAGDRNTWHAFDGELYFIEANGRPHRAYKYLPPIEEAPRISGCQTAVGQWGDEEVPSNDHDGGHMIGSSSADTEAASTSCLRI